MAKGRITAVVYDWDSTLANTKHRWHLAPTVNAESSWDIYSQACGDDIPLAGTARRMQMDYVHHQVHICSGSAASAREQRISWLQKHCLLYDYLQLRATGDRRPNGQIKIDYVKQLQADGIEVVLFYEDWPKVGRQIQEATGVPVLGINPFYEDDDWKREGAPKSDQPTSKSDGLGGGL